MDDAPEAPPRYNTDPPSTTPSTTNDLTILQAQVSQLQTQITTLLVQQQQYLLQSQRLSLIPDPPLYNGKSWFKEWYWKMIGKVAEMTSHNIDEKTKIEYIVSRLTESAFLTIQEYLPIRMRPEVQRFVAYRVVETADEIMAILKKKYS